MSLSTLIPTKNEEGKIRRCLNSISDISDEIVVLDSYSDDATVKICESYGARIIQEEFEGFSDLRKRLLQEAQNEWVLFIDADEELSSELAASVQKATEKDTKNLYRANRNVKMFGKWVEELGEQPLRLGPRELLHVDNSLVHEEIVPKAELRGEIKVLEGTLRHFAYDTISQYIDKFSQYTALEALEREKHGEKPRLGRSIGKGLLMATRYLVVKGALKAGAVSILFASLSFQYEVISHFKQVEIKELKEEKPCSWEDYWIQTECQR